MTRAATIAWLAKRSGRTKRQVAEVLDHLAALAIREARHGFLVPGFGRLVLARRKARIGRHPRTGAAIQIPAKRVVKVRIAKALRDAVLGTP